MGRSLVVAIILGLTALSVTAGVLRYLYGDDRFVEFTRLFLLSGEANVPTWFSSVLLFSAAALVGGAEERERRRGERRYLRHWWVLAAGLLYISLDEVAQIHELASEPLRELLNTGGILYHAG